jgi:hypothetical protein
VIHDNYTISIIHNPANPLASQFSGEQTVIPSLAAMEYDRITRDELLDIVL